MESDEHTPSDQSEIAAPQTNLSERTPVDKSTLPFLKIIPFLAGALIGLVLRLIFSGKPGNPFAPMDTPFILLAPMAVGAITIYIAETQTRRSWGYYMWAPAIANMLFVMGTLLIMIEGLICAIIIVPLFALMGALGGLAMGAICRMTSWPKHAAYSFAALPLLLGAFTPAINDNQYFGVVERTIVAPASTDKVWHQLHNVQDIQPAEVDQAWIYRIGVPLPISGLTQTTPTGLVRQITMGKSIHFEQVSTDWEVNRYVKWKYRFQEDSIPPHALDDHVKIGGHYFDMVDTEYILTPVTPQSTELKIRMHYRVSTQFNWYANPVAQLLIGNFEEVILDFYGHRSANTMSAATITK